MQLDAFWDSVGVWDNRVTVFKEDALVKGIVFFFFFFLSWLPHSIRSSLVNHSCDLSCQGGKMDPLTHCGRLGIKPASWSWRDTTDPIAHSKNSRNSFLVGWLVLAEPMACESSPTRDQTHSTAGTGATAVTPDS